MAYEESKSAGIRGKQGLIWICLLLFGLLLLPASATAATPGKRTGVIYFSLTGKTTSGVKSSGLWGIQEDGKNLHRVARGAIAVVPSPDGRQLICGHCVPTADLVRMDTDGSHVRPIALPNGSGPVESAFKTPWVEMPSVLSGIGTIALNPYEFNGLGLGEVAYWSPTTGIRSLYRPPPSEATSRARTTLSDVRFSPDGQTIAFKIEERLPCGPKSEGCIRYELYAMDAGGGAPRRIYPLTQQPPAPTCNAEDRKYVEVIHPIEFSADSSDLLASVYGACSRELPGALHNNTEDTRVIAIDVASGAARPFPLLELDPLSTETLSPDWTKVAFFGRTSDRKASGLFIQNLDGSGKKRLLPAMPLPGAKLSRIFAWGNVVAPQPKPSCSVSSESPQSGYVLKLRVAGGLLGCLARIKSVVVEVAGVDYAGTKTPSKKVKANRTGT